ncbi:MAG: hypothetical protein GY869_20290 [Planctomycetes bacterium]|nr:hypothetical protein [Planctomycetota bacterium]
MTQKKLFRYSVIILLFLCMSSSSLLACFCVVVGKNASFDGSVLIGHNEQNSGARYINFRRIPRIQHQPGAMVTFRGGAQIPQVAETYSYLWSQNPGASFGDAYFNEFGVAVVSNACGDRNARGEGNVESGGATYLFRRLVVERAKTAREGVQIAGKIIEQIGYGSSRSYTIADKNEAWMLSLTNGKQWVAQRIKDDEVAVLPNIYIIDKVDLNDKDHFLASPDLISYATEEGWYNPADGKPFSFCDAYSAPRRTKVDPRQWRAQSLVTGREVPETPDRQLPFAIKPSKKMTIKDVATVLRYHGGKGAICSPRTQEVGIFQLRADMPTEIGCVYWRTNAEPCTSILVPWYCGITETPPSYYHNVPVETQLTLEYQFGGAPALGDLDKNHAWLPFQKIQDWVAQNHDERCPLIRNQFDKFEDKLFAAQERFDARTVKLYQQDKEQAINMITRYSATQARTAVISAQSLIMQLKIE